MRIRLLVLVAAVALVAAAWALRKGGTWKMLGWGALFWTFTVALKFAWAIPINTPLSQLLGVSYQNPWAAGNMGEWTKLSVCLLRLGVDVIRTRIRHPQTLGKDERFNRTLLIECITGYAFSTFIQTQKHFDQWRDVYNFERPHESLGLKTPASRYGLTGQMGFRIQARFIMQTTCIEIIKQNGLIRRSFNPLVTTAAFRSRIPMLKSTTGK